ncbi:hypothetical protein, partial [Zhenhengia yiwuensis]|uniref:hypothetical protein n=1 Tax=Zhenhengia yiwuensis TaxID=2763666 RepID=UPI002A752814
MKERIRVKKTLTEEEKDNKRKINTLMNQTPVLFDLEQFERIEEDDEHRLSRKILYIKHRFEDLYSNHGYNLTLDVLANQ